MTANSVTSDISAAAKQERLQALKDYGILDTDPEAGFDNIARVK